MAEGSVGSSEERLGDPSPTTTDVIRREIAHLSDRIDLKIEGLEKSLVARIDAIERAAQVFHEGLVRVPTEVQKAVAAEHEVTVQRFRVVEGEFAKVESALVAMGKLKAEQFHAIQQQFLDRDARVAAALAAVKEASAEQTRSAALATSKQEAQFAKQIDGLQAVLNATTAALDAKIADNKDRLLRIEGTTLGQSGQKAEQHNVAGFTVSLVGVGIAILSVLISSFVFLRGFLGK